MKKKEDSWRHLTNAEKTKFRKAYTNTFGKVGRPPMPDSVKKKSVHTKLDPEVIAKFKEKSKKTGVPYQTLINQALKKAS